MPVMDDPRATVLAEFVGRGAQLADLERFLASEATVVHVSGIAGVGKSWLVEHFLDQLDPSVHPAAVVDLRYAREREPVDLLLRIARQMQHAIDFSALVKTVADYEARLRGTYRVQPVLNLQGPVELEVNRNRFEGPVGDIAAIIANVQVSVPGDELQRLREDRLADATRLFWEALEQAPASVRPVLVLDSFEHADRGGADPSALGRWLWGELLDNPQRRVGASPKFILVGQPALVGRRATRRLASGLMTVALDRFAPGELDDFFERNCGSRLTATMLEQATQLSHANPLCAALVAELINETDWERSTAGSPLAERAGTTLVADFLVGRILDGVDDELAAALRLAAVPRRCGEVALRRLSTDESSVLRLWRRLTSLSFVNPALDADWQIHELVRGLVQDEFERGDPAGFRQAHGKMAAELARQLAGGDWTSDPEFAEYVYHVVRADPSTKRTVGARYSRAALRARNAHLASSIAEATEGACGPAMAPWTDYSEAVARMLEGDVEAAKSSLQELWSNHDHDGALRLMAASALASAEQRSGALDEAVAWAERALELIRDEPEAGLDEDASIMAGCLNDLGTVLRAQIRLSEARDVYERAGELAGDGGDRWEGAYAELYRGVIFTAGLNDHEIAEAAFRSSEAGFRKVGDQIGVVMALQRRGWLERIRGRLREALALHELAEGQLPAGAEPLLLGELLHSKANVLRQMGRHAEATSAYERAREGFESASATRHVGLLEKDIGELELSQGRAQSDRTALLRAADKLSSSLAIKQQLGQEREASVVRCLLGETFTELGDTERANEELEAALSIARQTQVPVNQARAMAKIATLRSRTAQGYDPNFAERAAAYASSERFRHYVGEALVAKARHEAVHGHQERAAELLTDGLREAAAYNPRRAEELARIFLGGASAEPDSELEPVAELVLDRMEPDDPAARALSCTLGPSA
jgi:tetratricopeptide (TPR) repeat protein